jgi:hypothetical protein
VRCDLLRLNREAPETAGCLTGTATRLVRLQICNQKRHEINQKKRDKRLVAPVVSDLRQKTQKENSQ